MQVKIYIIIVLINDLNEMPVGQIESLRSAERKKIESQLREIMSPVEMEKICSSVDHITDLLTLWHKAFEEL